MAIPAVQAGIMFTTHDAHELGCSKLRRDDKMRTSHD